jgi:hypothetical protein
MTRVTYARERRKLADPLTSGHGPKREVPCLSKLVCAKIISTAEKKMFLIEVHPIAIGGAIALSLRAFKVEKHMIPDRPNKRQVRNTSIDQAQQANHSGVLMEDRLQIQRRNRYTDPHAGAHEKEW